MRAASPLIVPASFALALSLSLSLSGCPTPPDPTYPDADPATSLFDTIEDHDIEISPLGRCSDAGDCLAAWTPRRCQSVECLEGRCVLEDLPEGAPCDDGDPCTADDRCARGACGSGGPACDDGNPCTTDGCQADGACVHTFNQRPCDDGTACTYGDRCALGSCVGEALDCDDLEPCTVDWCEDALGCHHDARSGPCDDGDLCTEGDTCVEGSCEPGAPAVCGDPTSPCQAATCDPDLGCQITLIEGECDDHNRCTEGDTCAEGVCAGALITCADEDPCTDDYCDPSEGCQHIANLLPCDDGDPCTLGDRCFEGACVPGEGNPLCCASSVDCDDGDPCTSDACGDDGLCLSVPLDCDDGAACTRDWCEGGACHHDPFGRIPAAAQALADFDAEGDLDAWQLSSNNDRVAWRRDLSDSFSGAGSLYCGALPEHSYDFGATRAEASLELTVPPGQSALSLWARLDLEESASCLFDVLRIEIDGARLDPPLCESLATWTERSWDLSAWSGRRVRLTFEFSTEDDHANGGGGVWIDALRLTTVSDLACCQATSDCVSDATGCQAADCDPLSLACVVPPASVACDDGDPCTTDSCLESGACDHQPIADCP